MPNVQLICRECGKKYTACTTQINGVLRWKHIVCSPECFKAYTDKVFAGRAKAEPARRADDADE